MGQAGVGGGRTCSARAAPAATAASGGDGGIGAQGGSGGNGGNGGIGADGMANQDGDGAAEISSRVSDLMPRILRSTTDKNRAVIGSE